MTFISYAQNYEDVMLWRALKHVEKGFYIDVGANDPEIESVTKVFYDHGWMGINIEPLPMHYDCLQQERLRDINLCCAVGEINGEIDLWVCDVRGWATVVDKVVAQHVNEGHSGQYLRVPVRTLAAICKQYVNEEVHFLKIDVEGFEAAVLKGMDFSAFRPWIVIVEGTKPNSSEQVYAGWEHYLLAQGYEYAYADGLNRFYLAEEHADLHASFQYPPNIFDGFVLRVQVEAEAAAKHNGKIARQAQSQVLQSEEVARQAEVVALHNREVALQAQLALQQARTAMQQIEARAQLAEIKVCQLEQQINAIYTSNSWRITYPMREAVRILKSVVGAGANAKRLIANKVKFLLGNFVAQAARFIIFRPLLKAPLMWILRKFPYVEFRLRRAAVLRGVGVYETKLGCTYNMEPQEELSRRAQDIYARMKSLREREKN